MHVVISGKNQGLNRNCKTCDNVLNIVGVRCDKYCFVPLEVEPEPEEVDPDVEVEPEPEFKFWSDATNWPNETLPVDGDIVEIKSWWKMILDIPETPKLKFLYVNGILIFSDEIDITMHVQHIFVRAGEMHIGNETHPHQH